MCCKLIYFSCKDQVSRDALNRDTLRPVSYGRNVMSKVQQ